MCLHDLFLGLTHAAAWLWLYIADCCSACCGNGLLKCVFLYIPNGSFI